MTIDRTLSSQHGATLVIALTMLLAMTLIAMSMMDGAILQEHMASNSRQKGVSRYMAEAALNEAEKIVLANELHSEENIKALFYRSVKGYYSAVNLPLESGMIKTAVPVDFDITDGFAWDDRINAIAVDDLVDATVTAKSPQYIVEYIGHQKPDIMSVDSLNNEDTNQLKRFYFFRIVAIGWSRELEIYTVLQSIYRLDLLAQPATQTVANNVVIKGRRMSWSIIH